MATKLADLIAALEEERVLQEVRGRLERGDEALSIIKELQEGMETVGEKFKAKEYFLSELVLSAEIFTSAMKLLEPRLRVGVAAEKPARIVIGTPKGDIHDIGKNIVAVLLKAAGFEVYDLGVDVPVERFVDEVLEIRPQILGFSALMTTSLEPIKETLERLKSLNLRDSVKVIIGGGVTTEAARVYVGADAQTRDAVEGVELCRKLSAGSA